MCTSHWQGLRDGEYSAAVLCRYCYTFRVALSCSDVVGREKSPRYSPSGIDTDLSEYASSQARTRRRQERQPETDGRTDGRTTDGRTRAAPASSTRVAWRETPAPSLARSTSWSASSRSSASSSSLTSSCPSKRGPRGGLLAFLGPLPFIAVQCRRECFKVSPSLLRGGRILLIEILLARLA